jgi:alpha/beta superfamily hydrolase
MSLIGFMVYFMHHSSMPLALSSGVQSHADHEISYGLTPVPSQALPPVHVAKHLASDRFSMLDSSPKPPDNYISQDEYAQKHSDSSQANPVLLLAGYSYGALITTQLPSLSSINSIFSIPEIGSAAAEIRLRAEQLAMKQNDVFASIMASALAKSECMSDTGHTHRRGRSLHDTLSPRTCSAASSIRVGGEETNADIRKASHDSPVRRSFSIDAPEQIRKSIDRVRSLGHRPKDSAQLNSPQRYASTPSPLDGADSLPSLGTSVPEAPTALATPDKLPLLALDDLQLAYLLVSPLQGFITSLATMWTSSSSIISHSLPLPTKKRNHNSEARTPQAPSTFPNHSLLTNPTLAVFGTDDIFTSSKKLRVWARGLQDTRDSRFRHVEIQGAGHFWHERGVADVMRRAVREFVSGL